MVHRRGLVVRLVEWGSRRKFRKVPDPVKVALHNRPVLLSTALPCGDSTSIR